MSVLRSQLTYIPLSLTNFLRSPPLSGCRKKCAKIYIVADGFLNVCQVISGFLEIVFALKMTNLGPLMRVNKLFINSVSKQFTVRKDFSYFFNISAEKNILDFISALTVQHSISLILYASLQKLHLVSQSL